MNSNAYSGGVLSVRGGVVDVIDSRFQNSYSGLEGAAVLVESGTLTIAHSIIENGRSDFVGGCIKQ
eukprot:1985538-Prymnesium_polylepis.1